MSKVNFAEIQKSLSDELGCDNNISSILGTMSVVRPPTRGYEPPKEYKVTLSSFKPWLQLYIAKQQGIEPIEIANRIFSDIETKKKTELTVDQKKSYFAQVGTVNANLRALGKENLVVPTPKISAQGSVKSTNVTAESLGLMDLFG